MGNPGLHHLRKSQFGIQGSSHNDRVSGSTYIVGGVDTHIQIDAGPKGFMRRLTLAKTRTPFEGIYNGQTWGIEGTLTDTSSSFKIITMAQPKRDTSLIKLTAEFQKVGKASLTTQEVEVVITRPVRERLIREKKLIEDPNARGSRTKNWTLAPNIASANGDDADDADDAP